MRSVVVAVISFLFPGFGAGMTGRNRVLAGWLVALAFAWVGCVFSIWFLPVVLLVRIASGIDGFLRMRAHVARRPRVSLDWIAGLIAIGINIGIAVNMHVFAIESFKIPASSMVPTLAVNDHIYIEKLSALRGAISHGDVIVFQHPCQPDRDYIKRVIALAGETIEIRCGVVHVGGAPLASRLVNGEGCTYDDFDEYAGSWSVRTCSDYVETTGGHAYHVHHDRERPQRDARPGAVSDNKDFPQLDGAHAAPSCAGAMDMPSEASNQQTGSLVETKPGAEPCEPQLHYVVPPAHVFVLGDSRANSNDSRYWGSVPVENIRGRVRGIWLSNGPSGVSLRRFGEIE